jgi:16S rRNA processing protein RimM
VFVDFFNEKKKFFIEDVKKKKDYFLIKFRNFNSERDVELLIGKEIFIDKDNLVKLPEDQFFIHDLIGSEVYKNDKLLGIIKDVLNLPANDVYVVNDAEGNELLVPAVKEIILEFNPDTKMLILKPGDDLYETDED